MKEFNAIVLAHYNFTDNKGKEVKRTKLLVSLGEYGTTECTIPLDESLDILQEVKVTLGYKDNRFRVNDVIK